jgi:hypothetical protein
MEPPAEPVERVFCFFFAKKEGLASRYDQETSA